MNDLLNKATRFLFFTGKGGVGKTSMSCAVAVGLAEVGKKVLLISTDPASNLHEVLDTAPTGHTLRLLNLPSAWNDFIAGNETGSSCLGPVSGLAEQKGLYEQVIAALKNPEQTLLALVARAESMSLGEAARARAELAELGLTNQHLIMNGVFTDAGEDVVAQAFAKKSQAALDAMPAVFDAVEKTSIPFRPHGVMGIDALKAVAKGESDPAWLDAPDSLNEALPQAVEKIQEWDEFFESLETQECGVIMTMGKGGVGKTVMASTIAAELARRGHSVLLSTTDPAAHIAETIGDGLPNLTIDRIDPKAVTEQHCTDILDKNRDKLTAEDMELLEEELRSPCIEEIAVFQAFAKTVAKGTDQFIVLDTAPTGHTLLLLDSTEAYHREVAKSADDLPDEVKQLLPRIRDPEYTKVLIVALPEATPTHEAEDLQRDLRRAGIEPFGWIINRSFAVSGTTDSVLCAKGLHETEYIKEIASGLSTSRTVISPWVGEELAGAQNLQHLTSEVIYT